MIISLSSVPTSVAPICISTVATAALAPKPSPSFEGVVPEVSKTLFISPKVLEVMNNFVREQIHTNKRFLEPIPASCTMPDGSEVFESREKATELYYRFWKYDATYLSLVFGFVLAKAYRVDRSYSGGPIALIPYGWEPARLKVCRDYVGHFGVYYLQMNYEEESYIIDPSWLWRVEAMLDGVCTSEECNVLMAQLPPLLIAEQAQCVTIFQTMRDRLVAAGKSVRADISSERYNYHPSGGFDDALNHLLDHGVERIREDGKRYILKLTDKDVEGVVARIKTISIAEDPTTKLLSFSSSSVPPSMVPAISGCTMEDFIIPPRLGVCTFCTHKDGVEYYTKPSEIVEFYAGGLFKLILQESSATTILIVNSAKSFFTGSQINKSYEDIHAFDKRDAAACKEVFCIDGHRLAKIVVASWLMGERDLKGLSSGESNLGVVQNNEGLRRFFKIDHAQAFCFQGSRSEKYRIDERWLQSLVSYCGSLNLIISEAFLARAAQEISEISLVEFDKVCTLCENHLKPYGALVEIYIKNNRKFLFAEGSTMTTIREAVFDRIERFKKLVDASSSSSSSSVSASTPTSIIL